MQGIIIFFSYFDRCSSFYFVCFKIYKFPFTMCIENAKLFHYTCIHQIKIIGITRSEVLIKFYMDFSEQVKDKMLYGTYKMHHPK